MNLFPYLPSFIIAGLNSQPEARLHETLSRPVNVPHACMCQIQLPARTAKKSDLCTPRKETAQPQSQFPHLRICERFIYSQDRSSYFSVAEYADQSWEYINRSQKH